MPVSMSHTIAVAGILLLVPVLLAACGGRDEGLIRAEGESPNPINVNP